MPYTRRRRSVSRPRAGVSQEFRWKHNSLDTYTTGPNLPAQRFYVLDPFTEGGDHGSPATAADLRLVRKFKAVMLIRAIRDSSAPYYSWGLRMGLWFDRDGQGTYNTPGNVTFKPWTQGQVSDAELYTREGGIILNRKVVPIVSSSQFDTYYTVEFAWPKFNLNSERRAGLYMYSEDAFNSSSSIIYRLMCSWKETNISR